MSFVKKLFRGKEEELSKSNTSGWYYWVLCCHIFWIVFSSFSFLLCPVCFASYVLIVFVVVLG